MSNKPTLLCVNMRRIEKERLELIWAAKNLGYELILLTNTPPEKYFHSFFKCIYLVDTFDLNQALSVAKNLAKQYSIVGVPSCTEADVELVAHICAHLNLPGLPPAVAKQARNKFLMKVALTDYPDLLPAFARVSTPEELMLAMQKIGFPAVIKPTGASGSKGIFILHHEQEARKAFAQLKIIAQPNFDPIFKQYGAEFIVEEYLDGDEVSVEGFVVNHQVYLVGITDKWTTHPYSLEYQHIFPSDKPAELQKTILSHTSFIVKKLGFNNCAFHLEAKITTKGFRFIEVAARLGGDYITSHLVKMSSGINMYENLIQIATGNPIMLRKTHHFISGIRFILAAHSGQFSRFDGLGRVLQNPYVEEFINETPRGNLIKMPPEHFGQMRLAAFIVKHTDYSQCQTILEHLSQLCRARIRKI